MILAVFLTAGIGALILINVYDVFKGDTSLAIAVGVIVAAFLGKDWEQIHYDGILLMNLIGGDNLDPVVAPVYLPNHLNLKVHCVPQKLDFDNHNIETQWPCSMVNNFVVTVVGSPLIN